MTKKILITIFISLFSTMTWATVVRGHDALKSCDLYRVVSPDKDGKIIINEDEILLTSREAYGLSFRNMDINFDTREVLVEPTINIVLGMNRPLINGKAIIAENNPDFTFLINQLNRHVMLFEKLCIAGNKIVYATMLSDTPETVK